MRSINDLALLMAAPTYLCARPIFAAICLFGVLTTPISATQKMRSQTINLRLGQSKLIEIKPLHHFENSNPDILSATKVGGNIRVKALASGESNLIIKNLAGTLTKILTIKIRSAKPLKRNNSKRRGPPSFCGMDGIICSPDHNRITGVSKSFHRRDQALLYCRRHPYCTIDLYLTDEAFSDQQKHYRRIFSNAAAIAATPNRLPIIRFDCSTKTLFYWKKQVDAITGKYADRGLLLTECNEKQTGRTEFRITTSITLSQNESESTRSPILTPESTAHPYQTQFSINKGRLKNKQQHVIAKPTVVTPLNKEVKVTAGSESPYNQYDGSDNPPSLVWKKIGLIALFQLSESIHGTMTLKYDLSIKQGSTGRSISSNAIIGETSIVMNKEKFLGRVYLDSEQASFDKPYWFSHIPIIGPILSSRGDSTKNSTIEFKVFIQDEKGDGEQKAKQP